MDKLNALHFFCASSITYDSIAAANTAGEPDTRTGSYPNKVNSISKTHTSTIYNLKLVLSIRLVRFCFVSLHSHYFPGTSSNRVLDLLLSSVGVNFCELPKVRHPLAIATWKLERLKSEAWGLGCSVCSISHGIPGKSRTLSTAPGQFTNLVRSQSSLDSFQAGLLFG